MKLSEWAKRNGISYRTAWRLFRDGHLPVPAQQLATGTILVDEQPVTSSEVSEVTIYARISSRDKKDQLNAQVARLCEFATSKGYVVARVVTEIGSAMNGTRGKLIQILEDPKVRIVLVEHRDRLTRFGFEYLDALMRSSGRTILVLEKKEIVEDKNDLVRDMIEVLTSFCARLYGKRSAENRARKAVQMIEKENANHNPS